MPQYRAAILMSSRGPFAVVELTETQQRQLSADDRKALTGCVRDRHGTIPVVFVLASPSTMNALHGQEVDADLVGCLAEHKSHAIPWQRFDHGPAAAV